ncbi:MAG: UDP-N-acetylmuramoyl-L-alanyl-D-glutamate--2,6-diaminopimelate ligase, partial [Xanthobacteraceae bacterium]
AVAAAKADRVIVTDDNPRSEDAAVIRAAIVAAAPGAGEIGDRVVPFSDHEAVATALKELAA